MEFDVAVFKGTDLYQNLTQSQKEYTIKVLDDVQSYKAISESKLEISKEFGDRFRTGGEWDVKKKSYDVREGVVSNEYLGNFMYGLAGSVLGIEDKILVSAAAGQQQLKNKGKDIIENIEGSSRKKLMIALFSVLAIGIIGNSSTRESKRKVNIKKVDNRKVSEKAQLKGKTFENVFEWMNFQKKVKRK